MAWIFKADLGRLCSVINIKLPPIAWLLFFGRLFNLSPVQSPEKALCLVQWCRLKESHLEFDFSFVITKMKSLFAISIWQGYSCFALPNYSRSTGSFLLIK